MWWKKEEKQLEPNMILYCTCKEWISFAPKILQIFGVAGELGCVYTGSAWLYCPWCDKKLKKGNIKNEKASE